VLRYLATKPAANAAKAVLDKLHALLKERKSRPVDVNGLRALEAAEKSFKGTTDCIGEFKYVTNQEMLTLIEQARV
jgi:ferredoxin--NADP+ reductase